MTKLGQTEIICCLNKYDAFYFLTISILSTATAFQHDDVDRIYLVYIMNNDINDILNMCLYDYNSV